MVFPEWVSLVLVVLVLGTVALILFARRNNTHPSGIPGFRAAAVTRLIAWVVGGASVLGAFSAVGAVFTGGPVTVQLPVREFWPALPETVDMQTPLAVVQGGGFTQANVSVSGLDSAAGLWLAGAAVAQAAVAVVAALVVARLCTALMKGSFFAPQLVRGIRQVAAVVLVGGLGWQLCQNVGGALAGQQVLGATAWGMGGESIVWTDIHNIIGLPSVTNEWQLNLWPIGVALALLVLAELFRHGSRVQKDAAGLI